MNSLGLTGEVGIEGAHDNTGMAFHFLMKFDEVTPVESENGPLLTRRKSEDFRIRDC